LESAFCKCEIKYKNIQAALPIFGISFHRFEYSHLNFSTLLNITCYLCSKPGISLRSFTFHINKILEPTAANNKGTIDIILGHVVHTCLKNRDNTNKYVSLSQLGKLSSNTFLNSHPASSISKSVKRAHRKTDRK
jgi:hypothetical protein